MTFCCYPATFWNGGWPCTVLWTSCGLFCRKGSPQTYMWLSLLQCRNSRMQVAANTHIRTGPKLVQQQTDSSVICFLPHRCLHHAVLENECKLKRTCRVFSSCKIFYLTQVDVLVLRPPYYILDVEQSVFISSPPRCTRSSARCPKQTSIALGWKVGNGTTS